MSNLTQIAVVAAQHWGHQGSPPRLVAQRENAVFEISLPDGTQAALRLHRSGYQSDAAISAELLWTDRLAASGFPCAAPRPALSGALLVELEGGLRASAVSWIEATPLSSLFAPHADRQDQLGLFHDLGKLIKWLHVTTDALGLPMIERPSWDSDALLGENPIWGRFWENPALMNETSKTLQDAAKNAAQQLHDINNLDTGLIHADLLLENILKDGDQLHIIDFDDSGYGYRLYDLGTALIQHVEHPRFAAFAHALCKGYGCSPALMPLFTMLRGFASCGWIMSRAAADDPRQAFYAKRALRCVELFRAARPEV